MYVRERERKKVVLKKDVQGEEKTGEKSGVDVGTGGREVATSIRLRPLVI